ncbi:MAG: hypothetical protein QXH17_06715 [Candidatus Bathyarchaeia archaeon]
MKKGPFIGFLLFSLFILMDYPRVLSSSDTWWNSGWKYRRQINVTERCGYSLTDFPVEVYFVHGGKARVDGSDIRVVVDNIEIPSYVSYMDNSSAKVLFQVNLYALSTKEYYIYYGNPNASKPNYPLVPLNIKEGNNGYAVVDGKVYIGWSYSSWGKSDPVVIWDDYRIDFNENRDLSDDVDLIRDYGSRKGGIGRQRGGDGDAYKVIGLGDYRGYNQNPIFVEIEFADAKLRVYRNNLWVETAQADFLWIFSNTYTHASYGICVTGGGVEEDIVDGWVSRPSPYESIWHFILTSKQNPGWMALRDSSSGIIFASTGFGIGKDYIYTLLAKEGPDWDRVINYGGRGKSWYDPFKPYDQPTDCRIYWYGDDENSYYNIEKLAKILKNQPSVIVGDEETPTVTVIIGDEKPYIIIDKYFISDDRCDVGSTQTIGFHAKWGNNHSDVVEGKIYVNNIQYITNGSGWINVNATSSSVMKGIWTLTGVDVNGVTFCRLEIIGSCSVIWDLVNIKLNVSNNRVGVGSTVNITWSGFYSYDKTPFSGKIYYNDSISKSVVGKYWYTVSSIEDPKYGLTVFSSNEVYCIFDRINSQVKIEAQTPGVTQVTVYLNYEYDGSPVEGAIVYVNGVRAGRVGAGLYYANISSSFWSTYMPITIRAETALFEPILIETATYMLGNIILITAISVTPPTIIMVYVLLDLRKKRWLRYLRQLEELLVKSGQVSLEEASRVIGVEVRSIRSLLRELMSQGRVEGSFTSDGMGFITQEWLEKELRRFLV